MKIRLITAPTTYEAAINTIKQIDVTKAEEYNLLVVPDAFSMQAENLLFEVLNLKSVFNVEVVGISKLASFILSGRNVGYVRVSPLEEVFTIFKAVKACESEFEYFGKCDVDFCTKLLQIIKQLKGCKVRPEHIKEVRDVVLDRKMHDIKMIYQKYEEMLGEKLDLSKMLEFCQQIVGDGAELSKTNLYFANFDSFSLEINDFICKLSKVVGSICIGMGKASISQNNAYIFEDDILQKTTALAKENAVLVETENFASALDERRQKMAQNLFGFKVEGGARDDYFLNVLAKNKNEEVEFVAKYIKKEVFSGKKFKNFAVAAADESYIEKIKSTFEKYGITFYSDEEARLSQTVLARFLLKMLEIAKLGFSQEQLQFIVRNPLIAVEDRDAILKDIWHFNVEDSAEFLQRFPQFKALVTQIDLLSKCKTISQFANALSGLVSIVEAEGEKIVLQLGEKGLFKEESQNQQAITLVRGVLDKLCDLGKDEAIELLDFENLFTLSLDSVKVETIPSYIDAVYVGDASKSYFEDVETLFVLGATATALPQMRNDTGIIDDDDIEKLRLQFLLEPQIKVLNRRSRLKLFECLLHAKQKLIVTVPLAEEGKISAVSDFVKDLRKLFGDNVLRTQALEDIKTGSTTQKEMLDNLKFFVGTKANLSAAYALLKNKQEIPARLEGALLENLDKEIFKAKRQDILSGENKKVLLPNNRVSASALETYFSCPFKHFMSYGLKIRQEESIEPNRRLFGVFEHALLEKFVKTCENIGELSQKEIERFLDENVQEIAREVYDEKILKRKHFVAYLKNESRIVLWNVVYEQKYSRFRPHLLEERVVSCFEEGQTLVGFVDRVDTTSKFFRIFDYKTGRTQTIKKDLYYGKKLQLFLYADAMQKKLVMQCGGVYYFDCQTKYSKADRANRLNGLTLADDEAVLASDTRLVDENFKSDIAGFAVKKSATEGQLSFKGGNPVQNFDKFFSYARKVSAGAIKEIKEGYILDKPVLGDCANCPYISVCCHKEEDGYRILQSVKDEDIKG